MEGNMIRSIWLPAAILACWAWTPAWADEKRPDAKGGSSLDNEFLLKAHSANNAELEYSKLVEKRSANQKVKDFAEQMLRDHREVRESLGKLFKDRKVGSVAGTEREVRDEVDRLSKLSGAEFDREYMKRLVQDHDAALTLFETQARDGKDNAITAWTKEVLPTLKKHQQQAKELSDEVNGKK
jgi:putative membrane protein